MSRRGAVPIALWLATLALAAGVAIRARYVADLSALLPARPTAEQRLLVDLLRSGPASRTVLIAVEGGDAATRARASAALAAGLRGADAFLAVENGDAAGAARDRAFVFAHRYALSPAIDARHFSAQGLHDAIAGTIDDLATPAGPWLKALLPRDPTGEVERIAERLGANRGPRTRDGVWTSSTGDRALLVAELRASGADLDGEQHALEAIRGAFDRARGADPDAARAGLRLLMSGPPVFAVAARAKIERAALVLSICGGVLVIALLYAVYRSAAAVLLGLLPVVTGALVGVAAVAAAFGAVHGLTLGFGITLIGEAVDYSIYYFLQSSGPEPADARGETGIARWQRRFWPTVRLGALTSICGFATLLPSGFPGLAQLGLYSVAGLVAAALVTRHVLPRLSPRRLRLRSVAPLGAALRACVPRARIARALAVAVAAIAVLALARDHGRTWNHDLSSLSPVSAADRDLDAAMRADLGAADVRDIVVATGADREAALRAAERAGAALAPLVDAGVISGFDSPANYLPSLAVQDERRRSLPDAVALDESLRRATADLPLRDKRLPAFVADVEAARSAPALTPAALSGTTLGLGFDGLMLRRAGGFVALLPLRAPLVGGLPAPIDLARVRAALGRAGVAFDLKAESDAIYAGYLNDALRSSALGFAAIALLLVLALGSVRGALAVLAPLALAVLAVAAAFTIAGERLTILHLVGMLLIVAIGSNYALFFARHADAATIGSLAVANAATVAGFGLLTVADVPVLRDLGMTVAPGALLAFVFCTLLAPRAEPRNA